MKCNTCGTELIGTEQICPVCGAPVAADNLSQPYYVNQTAGGGSSSIYGNVAGNPTASTVVAAKSPAGATAGLILGILAIVFSYFLGGLWLGIPGIIVSSIALKKCSAEGRPGKGKAIAGLVISGVSIFVTLIVAVLMAALMPSFLKYQNKSELSTAISDGTTVASAINAALASEDAYYAAKDYYNGRVIELNDLLTASDDFGYEVYQNLGRDHLEGAADKDLYGNKLTPVYYIMVDVDYNQVNVWYGSVDDEHMVSPMVGTALSDY